ncbi:hypothetical protein ACOI8K_09040, partial [Bifidobacterium hominis]|uniref:hypothetical protein n=1 Tax=Bifidobacterium hominis TaxID=3133177 RepID=UPI003D08EBDC
MGARQHVACLLDVALAEAVVRGPARVAQAPRADEPAVAPEGALPQLPAERLTRRWRRPVAAIAPHPSRTLAPALWEGFPLALVVLDATGAMLRAVLSPSDAGHALDGLSSLRDLNAVLRRNFRPR